jgi:predicted esterase
MKKKKRFARNNLALFLFLLSGCFFMPVEIKGQESNTDQAVQLSRTYLKSSGDKKAELGKLLDKYNGPVEPVIQKLIASEPKLFSKKTGVIEAEHFKRPGVSKEYKDDLLYFFVPEDYGGTKPFGLLVFMHGGNKYIGSSGAKTVVSPNYIQPYLKKAPFILVAPTARWKGRGLRWNQPGVDDYISAVIQECRYRYNIDKDRVFLGGQSLGGFGAYHLCQRLSDRIAGGILCAGSWRVINWRCMFGTPLYIIHGEHDSAPTGIPGRKHRPRYTDVFFARMAHKRLTEEGIEHVYAEHASGHSLCYAGKSLSGLAGWMKDQKRDPFFRHLVAVTPRGWDARNATPTPHNRWVSILEIGDEKIAFDSVKFTGPGMKWGEPPENWKKQKWELTETTVRAGLVDAEYKGNNVFEVKTENVRKFSLWLHPNMVDFSKPVKVIVNGKTHLYKSQANLLDALRSYERRQDWGLIYHSELVLDVASHSNNGL